MSEPFVMFRLERPTREGFTHMGRATLPDGSNFYIECRAIPATPEIRAHFKGAVTRVQMRDEAPDRSGARQMQLAIDRMLEGAGPLNDPLPEIM